MSRPVLTRFALPMPAALAAVIAVAGPALATSAPAQQPVSARAMISPLPGAGPRTAAATRTAAQACVQYATRAGWANNGYYSGDLVTAAAVCAFESGGDPNLIVCDPGLQTGDFPAFTCPGGTTSYDRGLWQLNTAAPDAVNDTCAFNPVCNADTAYLASQRGTDFSPWSSYDNDKYKGFIDPVQAVVNNLHAGTVTSAELGECLVPVKSAVNSKITIANCGTGSTLGLWSITGDRLRSGSVCAAIGSTSRTPGIVLRRCARNSRQLWITYGRDELRNVADGECLTDPNGSLTAGTQVVASRCANLKDQTWWLP